MSHTAPDRDTLSHLARLVRYFILISTTQAQSGHVTSSFSAVELMTMLYFKYLRYDLDNPDNPANDRVIFSKGHASPLFYSLYAVAGKLSEQEMLTLRTFDSPLEGHPVPRFRYTEAATGSLGQGLSVGVGEALALRREARQPPNVYVLLGDGEMAEGSNWTAMACARHYDLNTITAIVDVNRLGQSQETMYGHDTEVYRAKFEAFGWGVIVIDGHDWGEIDAAFEKSQSYRDGPTAIIAKTIKGKGYSAWEDKNGWHGKSLSKKELPRALSQLGKVDHSRIGRVRKPDITVARAVAATKPKLQKMVRSVYKQGEDVATRKAFGNALLRLADNYPQMVVLDGDMKNSTYTDAFAKAYPDRFYQMYIAEQNMLGVALGMSACHVIPWATTFASFLTRAHDQIRMASLSGATLKVCGSHAGVSIGQDGPSQMGLSDIAMMRAIVGSTVVYPADAWATERLVEEMMELSGIAYIRTTRPKTPIVYSPDDTFPIGGSKLHKAKGGHVRATVVAAGITLHEALKAQAELARQKINIHVLDCYSVKPIDTKTLHRLSQESRHVLVVEDHYPEGGLGEAVMSAYATGDVHIHHLAVSKLPHSGKPEELFEYMGISTRSIVDEVIKLG